MSVSRQEVLRLFRNLIIYSKKLTLTDSKYFRGIVVREFKRNKDLKESQDIEFAYLKGKAVLTRSAVV